MPNNHYRQKSMTGLLVELVSHPSRSGEDSCEPVLRCISSFLAERRIDSHLLHAPDGCVLGLWGEICGTRPGPSYVLNAPADTAPFGDLAAWTQPPDRATIADGWLYGRGSADSKAGISVFCHVIAALPAQRANLSGKLGFVFDAEEHSGTFAGIRSYLASQAHNPIDGCMIGYPGNDRVIAGARGFLRVRILIHGIASHSGSSSPSGINAIERARKFLHMLAESPLPAANLQFPLPPKVTTTGIRGGGSYTLTPDKCELDIDFRLTPGFNHEAAQTWLERLIKSLDADSGTTMTEVNWLPGWPAYQLPPDQPMVGALMASAHEAFGHEIPPAVAGPSSIANLLATQGIPATAGLGVSYRNIHGPDECIALDTLEPTYQTYMGAVKRLLK